jgi:hypothetical protein
MKKYHKINTVFKRGPRKELLEGEFSLPEFEYLKDTTWVWTEKVDGTNIRVRWNGLKLEYLGKTDSARIPEPLHDVLTTCLLASRLMEVFGMTSVCLYGEGYGPSIGKGGKNWRGKPHGFMLFDVRIGEWWLQRDSLEDIATRLYVDLVPLLGKGTLSTMVELCSRGFQSKFGDFQAEGVIAQPSVQLFNRKGERIITKLKCADFRKRG